MGNLGIIYQEQDKLQQAELLQVQVMQSFMRVLGEEHPDTLRSRGNLAGTYQYQGRLMEAEQMYVQVIEMKRIVLQEDL